MAHLDRTFGVEIEAFLPEGTTPAALATAINSRIGEGRCHAETYNHQTRPVWKIVTDGSLGDYARGIEVVSPILQGETGLAEMEAVLDAMQDFGCSVSKACGLHIHVGVGAPELRFFKTLTRLYSHYEGVIDAFMPASRRASQNTYCRTMTTTNLDRLERCETLDAIISQINAGVRATEQHRYRKLNFCAYRRYRTVEFRQHSGTLEPKKARNWTLLCLRMVDAAAQGRTPGRAQAPATAAQTNKARNGSKARIVGDLMLRPEGVTSAEAMAATGWPSISLPQQAAACGLTFITERTGREVRYFATATAAAAPTTPAAPSLASLMETIGASPAEADYFRTRTLNLSGPTAWAA